MIWHGLNEMLDDLVRTQEDIHTSAETMVKNSTKAVKAKLTEAAAQHGPRIVAGVRGRAKGHGLDTVGTVYLTGNPANVMEKGRPTPYPMVAKPGSATRKRKGAKALFGGYGHPVTSLIHGPIRAQPFFAGAIDAAGPDIDAEMDRANLTLHSRIVGKR